MKIENPKFNYGDKVVVVNAKKGTVSTQEIDRVEISKNYSQSTTYVFKDGTKASPYEVFSTIDDVFAEMQKELESSLKEFKQVKFFAKNKLPDIIKEAF